MRVLATLVAAGLMTTMSLAAQAAETPYQVEWVYHIQSGHEGEWWKIFQKYQIATLDREKQLGFVSNYIVEKPGLHTSEDARWNYRVVITFPSYEASRHEGEVERQLFPDRAAMHRDEDRRGELTVNHWDLPIRQIDPHQVSD